MKEQLGAVIGLFVALTWSAMADEQEMHACSLLTSGEVDDAVGGQVLSTQQRDVLIPAGPLMGETVGSCAWRFGARGVVAVTVEPAAQGVQRRPGPRIFDDVLRARNWHEERKDLGDARCSTWTPPSSVRDEPIAMCVAEAKGMQTTVRAARARVPIERVKALLDKAIGRLP
jgi:hypothetical protein